MLPSNVLEWLWHQLEFNYTDLTRVYREVVECLEQVPSLRPRTDVYTTEQGHSDLLLVLFGPLAANVGGVTYGIPIEIWIPKQYPTGSPIVWVRPTPEMRVHPSSQVDINGRVYFEWSQQLSLVGLCQDLSHDFGQVCPVYASPATRQFPATPHVKAPEPEIQHTKHVAQNIMDSDDIKPPSIPPRSSENWDNFHATLQKTVSRLIENEVDVDLVALGNTTQVLEWMASSLNNESLKLSESLSTTNTSIQVLDESIANARALIAKSFSPKYSLPTVDEVLVPKSAAAKDLLEAQAQDAALGDTIKSLAKGFAQEKLPLDLFLKNVRSLARDQFVERHKATLARTLA